eukprot:UN19459
MFVVEKIDYKFYERFLLLKKLRIKMSMTFRYITLKKLRIFRKMDFYRILTIKKLHAGGF